MGRWRAVACVVVAVLIVAYAFYISAQATRLACRSYRSNFAITLEATRVQLAPVRPLANGTPEQLQLVQNSNRQRAERLARLEKRFASRVECPG